VRFLAGLGIRAKRTEPVVLNVSEIRSEIFAASTGVWRTRPAGRLLSRIFHESISDLFRPGPRNWQRTLSATALASAGALERHMYESFIAPRLTRYQGALKESTAEVLQFWSAVKEWCEWFRGVVRTGLELEQLRYDEAAGAWSNADRLVEPDRHLSYTFEDPEWTAPVMIQGRADALVRRPAHGGKQGSEDWCVIEYRAGTGAAEADLAQAVMYGLMLDAPDHAAITLIQLHPNLKEVAYTSYELKTGIELLKPIVARLAGVLPGVQARPGNKEEDPAAGENPSTAVSSEASTEQHVESGNSLDLAKLAGSPAGGFDQAGARIVSVCKEFGADVMLSGPPQQGPAFIRYQLNPASGVSAKKIAALALDLQVRLGLESSPFIRVDRGKLVVDVARKDRQQVWFSDVRSQFPRTDVSSRVPIGVDLLGSLKFADLANPVSAHMLVAGATGSGKTEWLRTVIGGLILQNTPQSLRFALIDPKGGAFTDWQGSPFLWRGEALVSRTGARSPVELLDELIVEMESRYRVMEQEGVDDLARLTAKTRVQWQRIVCICDEYADLVTRKSERREVESRIARLGSKARASGIHLIIATQRPSRDIVEGTLKANLSAKVALRVNSPIESRLVLGVGGAECLLGEGDLLYQDAGLPVRLQAPLLRASERSELLAAAPSTNAV
jgi:S-DNA-T family DNA segregation ATPase FtsK/SpoIIIE